MPEWSTCGLIELHLQASRRRGSWPTLSARGAPGMEHLDGGAGFRFELGRSARDAQAAWPGWSPQRRLLGTGGAQRRPAAAERAARIGRLGGPRRRLPDAAKVWYGKLDATRASRWGGSSDGGAIQWGGTARLRDDALLGSPPQDVPISKKEMPRGAAEDRLAAGLPAGLKDGAVLPVWLLVEIPKDAAPGRYRGVLTVTADGRQVAETPVALEVLDWTLPDPADYSYFMGMIQSPEAVALAYGTRSGPRSTAGWWAKPALDRQAGRQGALSAAGRREPVRERAIHGALGARRRRQADARLQPRGEVRGFGLAACGPAAVRGGRRVGLVHARFRAAWPEARLPAVLAAGPQDRPDHDRGRPRPRNARKRGLLAARVGRAPRRCLQTAG